MTQAIGTLFHSFQKSFPCTIYFQPKNQVLLQKNPFPHFPRDPAGNGSFFPHSRGKSKPREFSQSSWYIRKQSKTILLKIFPKVKKIGAFHSKFYLSSSLIQNALPLYCNFIYAFYTNIVLVCQCPSPLRLFRSTTQSQSTCKSATASILQYGQVGQERSTEQCSLLPV